MNVKSLMSIRDDLTSLLQKAPPVEAHRLRKIIDNLNVGIPLVIYSRQISLYLSQRSESNAGSLPNVNGGLATGV